MVPACPLIPAKYVCPVPPNAFVSYTGVFFITEPFIQNMGMCSFLRPNPKPDFRSYICRINKQLQDHVVRLQQGFDDMQADVLKIDSENSATQKSQISTNNHKQAQITQT